jgi:hypothetical protein
MSQNALSTSLTSSPTSSFHTIFCDALKRYRDKTKNDLFTHPLTADLQSCNRPSEFLAVLHRKYNVEGFIQSRRDNQTSTQWLNATSTVLASFSSAIGEGVGLVSHQKLTFESSFLKYYTWFAGVLARESYFRWDWRTPHSR